jgi:hypothetical protein
VFGRGEVNLPKDSHFPLAKITGNVDGQLPCEQIQLNFTPDIIYGGTGYDTFYGVTIHDHGVQ